MSLIFGFCCVETSINSLVSSTYNRNFHLVLSLFSRLSVTCLKDVALKTSRMRLHSNKQKKFRANRKQIDTPLLKGNSFHKFLNGNTEKHFVELILGAALLCDVSRQPVRKKENCWNLFEGRILFLWHSDWLELIKQYDQSSSFIASQLPHMTLQP